ncbi:RNA ligase family protein [Rhodococcus sp. NPDC003994]
MTLTAPKNPNYAAVVTTVKTIVTLPNRDRIVGIPVFGSQAIVQKHWQVGDVGVYIPAESQLSDLMAKVNNLYRHPERNADTTVTGYLDDNRRVKAIKLGGHRSDAMFLPLEAFAFTGYDVTTLQDGDTFDTLNGVEVLRKYVLHSERRTTPRGQGKRIPPRVDEKVFPQHYDTSNYFRAANALLRPEDRVVVTQKLHGTSIRIGNVPAARKLRLIEKVAQRLGVRVQDTEYDTVYGSRRQLRDVNAADFTADDLYTTQGRKLLGLLPEGFVLFGELIGWDGEKPIQRGYTYGLPVGATRLYVYRVSFVTAKGLQTDLPWAQVKEFCASIGVATVPELWLGRHDELAIDQFMDGRYVDDGFRHAVQVGRAKGIVDEGVCVRRDGNVPTILKAKSPAFLRHETKMFDLAEPDIEAAA